MAHSNLPVITADLYTIDENGKPAVVDRHQYHATTDKEALRQAREWAVAAAGVLSKATNLRVRTQDGETLLDKPLAEYF
jgi:hypothetical protein